VNTLNTSPEGNRKAPMVPARMNDFDRSWLACFDLLGEVRPGVVRAQRLGAGDQLADVGHHVWRCGASLVVGPRQVALHPSQHEGQRRCHDEGHDGEHPVVGQHHAGHQQHQRAVEQPGEAAPLEELRERLDVAGDASHQRALPLLAVVGDAEAVDVLEQAHAQGVERLLAAPPQPRHGRALRPRGDHDAHQRDGRHGGDECRRARPPASEAVVDRLLHEDGDDHSAGGAHHEPARA
jgi:hypothetical protein